MTIWTCIISLIVTIAVFCAALFVLCVYVRLAVWLVLWVIRRLWK